MNTTKKLYHRRVNKKSFLRLLVPVPPVFVVFGRRRGSSVAMTTLSLIVFLLFLLLCPTGIAGAVEDESEYFSSYSFEPFATTYTTTTATLPSTLLHGDDGLGPQSKEEEEEGKDGAPTTVSPQRQYKIKGLKPSGASSKKCYIYLMGTGQNIERETYYDTFLEDMSVHGYCAAVVEYPGSSFLHYAWSDFPAKSAAIFTTTRSQSAIRRLEAASDGACRCDQLVVHGFSQGGQIAVLAANYNPHVTGILLFSGQCQANLLDSCAVLEKNQTVIPQAHLRNIFAQQDGVLGCGFGDTGRTSLAQTKLVTGYNCDDHHNTQEHCTLQSCRIDNSTQCRNECTCSNFVNNCFHENENTTTATDDDAPDTAEKVGGGGGGGGGGYYALTKEKYPNKGHQWFLEAESAGGSSSVLRIWDIAMTTSEPFNIPNNLEWLRNTTLLVGSSAAEDNGEGEDAEIEGAPSSSTVFHASSNNAPDLNRTDTTSPPPNSSPPSDDHTTSSGGIPNVRMAIYTPTTLLSIIILTGTLLAVPS